VGESSFLGNSQARRNAAIHLASQERERTSFFRSSSLAADQTGAACSLLTFET
jgi:hypothetical protein